MPAFEFFLTGSLTKVFPAQRPAPLPENPVFTALQGEVPALQLVYSKAVDGNQFPPVWFTVALAGAPCPARLREVGLVGCDYPVWENADDGYLTHAPGLFPDPLYPLPGGRVRPLAGQYRALWVDFPLENAIPGEYAVTLTARADAFFEDPNGDRRENEAAAQQVFTLSFTLKMLAARLPEQTLLHTEWFHADCLANYYHAEPLSERHWALLENFIAPLKSEYGANMLLTPVFSPPLDTAVGTERTIVQLADIAREGGAYRFGFDKLARWCALCQKYGITHIEVPHLFTQWGAHATPNIYATVDGAYRRLFGWDVPATSPEYRAFLEVFIPALREKLAEFGFDGAHVYFHISDEPSAAHLDSYKAAKAQVADLLAGCPVVDALSDYAFYAGGLVEQPIPANDHIQPFLDNHVPDLWVYYCCAQGHLVPNRFYAMPSARNRIMGVLMYLYGVKGFLQWGYNFYNSQNSLAAINPYAETSAGHAFPGGDPFLVYPGGDGRPVSSLRAQVQREGLDDLRALQLLEQLAGRDTVETLIYEGHEKPFTFTSYPCAEHWLPGLRARVNAAIEARL